MAGSVSTRVRFLPWEVQRCRNSMALLRENDSDLSGEGLLQWDREEISSVLLFFQWGEHPIETCTLELYGSFVTSRQPPP